MHNEHAQRHTETINQLLNQTDVLLPTGHQFRWANEYDSISELRVICRSFISDINYALESPHCAKHFGRLEAQINYGGVFIDEQPPYATTFHLNREVITLEWLHQLKNALLCLYISLCTLHHCDSLTSSHQDTISCKSCGEADIESNSGDLYCRQCKSRDIQITVKYSALENLESTLNSMSQMLSNAECSQCISLRNRRFKSPTTIVPTKSPDYPSLIEQLSKQAHQSCGLSYELYLCRFQSSVDELIEHLPEDEKETVIALAVKHDYLSEQPNEATQSDNDRHEDTRYCSHGIDVDCCPAGCGG